MYSYDLMAVAEKDRATQGSVDGWKREAAGLKARRACIVPAGDWEVWTGKIGGVVTEAASELHS